MQYKTSDLKRLLETALQFPSTKDIANNFLDQIPAESNYLIYNPVISAPYVIDGLAGFKQSHSSFRFHFRVSNLSDQCYLKVSSEQNLVIEQLVEYLKA